MDCRGAFQNLEEVKRTLVWKVLGLAMKATKLKRGKNKRSKRFMEFVKACLAYCFITIPSINKEVDRLKLLALAGQGESNSKTIRPFCIERFARFSLSPQRELLPNRCFL